ncbi:MAG: hypothetical protein R3Y53_04980 [Bacillota bacterium]
MNVATEKCRGDLWSPVNVATEKCRGDLLSPVNATTEKCNGSWYLNTQNCFAVTHILYSIYIYI